MKNSLKITFAVMIAAGGVLIQSCQKEDQPGLNSNTPQASDKAYSVGRPVFYGPTVPVGNGTARAWVRQNDEGDPVEVGIDLSEKALQNLPDENASWVLLFPRTKGKNFYTHMLVDWNPHGHEPVGVYDLPHFDFHFYYVSNEERLGIPGVNPPYMDPAPAFRQITLKLRVLSPKWEFIGLM
jgi:hypothetical protein